MRLKACLMEDIAFNHMLQIYMKRQNIIQKSGCGVNCLCFVTLWKTEGIEQVLEITRLKKDRKKKGNRGKGTSSITVCFA